MPVESTIAMLNLDMVGRERIGGRERTRRGTVNGSGPHGSSQSERIPLKIKREGPGAGRSDDYNFLVRRIPAINFFTGFHGDYHRPGDDWQKIDAAGTSQVARLALELAAALANRSSRPEFVSTQ